MREAYCLQRRKAIVFVRLCNWCVGRGHSAPDVLVSLLAAGSLERRPDAAGGMIDRIGVTAVRLQHTHQQTTIDLRRPDRPY
jgi:hypothetical protein